MIALFVLALAPQLDLAAATRAVEAGRYDVAAAIYARALEEPGLDRAALHYDLGNCAFLAGEHAAAALQYRRALLRAPGDAEARANLRLAEEALGLAPRAAGGLVAGLRQGLTALDPRAALALASGLQVLGVVAWALARGRRGARLAAALLVVLGLCCAAPSLRARWGSGPLEAVVLEGGAVLRAGPHLAATPLATLRPGELVRVKERSDRWARVAHPTGGGWIERAAVGLVD